MKTNSTIITGLMGVVLAFLLWLFPSLLGVFHFMDLHHVENFLANEEVVKVGAIFFLLVTAYGWKQGVIKRH